MFWLFCNHNWKLSNLFCVHKAHYEHKINCSAFKNWSQNCPNILKHILFLIILILHYNVVWNIKKISLLGLDRMSNMKIYNFFKYILSSLPSTLIWKAKLVWKVLFFLTNTEIQKYKHLACYNLSKMDVTKLWRPIYDLKYWSKVG